MSNNTVEITLLTSNKAGILSSVMLKCAKLGLMLRKNQIEKINDDMSRLTVIFDGEPTCSNTELIETLEALPEIRSIEKTSLPGETTPRPVAETSTNNQAPPVKTTNSGSANLQAHDTITAESLKIAEDILANFLGPVAPMLVESAAEKTKHIGDLYVMLSEELEPNERSSLLSLVNGL